jgi:hypothetical protein
MKTQKQEMSQQHAVMSILSAINMVPEGRERGAMVEAMVIFVFRAWGWNVQKFTEELDACRQAMQEHRGQLVTWFTAEGFQFDFRPQK